MLHKFLSPLNKKHLPEWHFYLPPKEKVICCIESHMSTIHLLGCLIRATDKSGDAMVYGSEPLTLDQRVVGSIHTFVLQQDTLSILLLSNQLYKWVPGRMWRIYLCIYCLNATIGSSARNAPLGVEIVHCKCGLEIVSNDQGNNSMLSHVAPWTSSLDGYVCIVSAAIIIIIINVIYWAFKRLARISLLLALGNWASSYVGFVAPWFWFVSQFLIITESRKKCYIRPKKKIVMLPSPDRP